MDDASLLVMAMAEKGRRLIQNWNGRGPQLANGMLDVDAVNRMFDEIKIAYEEVREELIGHRDPDSSFHVDIGGEG